jgi:hypothetical protein
VLRALTALRVRRVPRVRQDLRVILALLRLFLAPPGRRVLLAPQVPRALPDLRVTLVWLGLRVRLVLLAVRATRVVPALRVRRVLPGLRLRFPVLRDRLVLKALPALPVRLAQRVLRVTPAQRVPRLLCRVLRVIPDLRVRRASRVIPVWVSDLRAMLLLSRRCRLRARFRATCGWCSLRLPRTGSCGMRLRVSGWIRVLFRGLRVLRVRLDPQVPPVLPVPKATPGLRGLLVRKATQV